MTPGQCAGVGHKPAQFTAQLDGVATASAGLCTCRSYLWVPLEAKLDQLHQVALSGGRAAYVVMPDPVSRMDALRIKGIVNALTEGVGR